MPRKFFCVLDTETVTRSRKVFDLGYMIMDRQGNIYEHGSYVVAEQIDTVEGIAELVKDDFTKEKCAMYLDDIINEHSGFSVAPFDTIREIVNDAIKNYNATLCAYNLAFDLNVLNKTSQFYLGCDFFEQTPELFDIWEAAMSTLCQSARFIKFVAENSILTDSGNPQTGAEAVYKFISDNIEFEEAHTAFKDCEIECAILSACIRTHKKISHNVVKICVHNTYWKNIVQRYYEYVQN